ncbi:MAG: isopentenyl-diphosphate Delta-isomerase [Bacteroidales bacterium]
MDFSKVILVNESDQEIGIMDKLEVHKKGILHRAISVFVFNSKGEWLLQQRASDKYHSGGLWTNTCCSHPAPGESTAVAAERRLIQEMGMHCSLKPVFNFIYRDELDNNLTEHELDHVFVGYSDDIPKINTAEVKDYAYIDFGEIENKVRQRPDLYTAWFKRIFRKVHETVNQK